MYSAMPMVLCQCLNCRRVPVRELANDVTLTGAEEPAVYIEEIFLGDGTTTVFNLSESAYRDTNRTLVLDNFNEAALNPAQWSVADPGSYLSLTSAGLTMNGGNGSDGPDHTHGNRCNRDG